MPVLLKVTGYYLLCALLIGLIAAEVPWVSDYLPVGKAARLFSTPSGPVTLDSAQIEPTYAGKFESGSKTAQLVFVLLSFVSSGLVMIPVVLVHTATRVSKKKKNDPFIVRTIFLLPILVTGLVLIVQNSLALAFSLAGVVAGAGIRFRMQIRQMTDTLYFLVAIAVGLASGVGSLGLAAIMSFVFSYTALAVHGLEVGGVPGEAMMEDKDAPAEPDKA